MAANPSDVEQWDDLVPAEVARLRQENGYLRAEVATLKRQVRDARTWFRKGLWALPHLDMPPVAGEATEGP